MPVWTLFVSLWKNICWRHRIQSISRELLLRSTCGGHALCTKYCITCSCAVVCESRTEYRELVWFCIPECGLTVMCIDALKINEFACICCLLIDCLCSYESQTVVIMRLWQGRVVCVSTKKTLLFRPKKESKGWIVEVHSSISKTLGARCVAEFRIFQVLGRQFGAYTKLYILRVYNVTSPAGSGAAPYNQTHSYFCSNT